MPPIGGPANPRITSPGRTPAVAADQLRRHRSSIRQRDGYQTAPLDHVMVGQQKPVRSNHDTRRGAVLQFDTNDRRGDNLNRANGGLRIRVE